MRGSRSRAKTQRLVDVGIDEAPEPKSKASSAKKTKKGSKGSPPKAVKGWVYSSGDESESEEDEPQVLGSRSRAKTQRLVDVGIDKAPEPKSKAASTPVAKTASASKAKKTKGKEKSPAKSSPAKKNALNKKMDAVADDDNEGTPAPKKKKTPKASPSTEVKKLKESRKALAKEVNNSSNLVAAALNQTTRKSPRTSRGQTAPESDKKKRKADMMPTTQEKKKR